MSSYLKRFVILTSLSAFFVFLALTSFNTIKTEGRLIYEIRYFEKSNAPPSLETIASIAHVQLLPQKIMGSIPRLALSTAIYKLGLKPNEYTDQINIDISFIYDYFLKFTGHSPFGSIILFNYNTIGLNYNSYTNYIRDIKNKYTLSLKLHNTYNNKNYLLQISPIIASDCVPSNVERPYCRFIPNFNIHNNVAKNSKIGAEDYFDISDNFKKFNLDTPLGPVVDIPFGSTNDDIANISNYGLNAAKHLFSNNLIPTYKHFLYPAHLGDTHSSTPVDVRSFKDINKELKPYYLIDRLRKPYFIMTGHHVINAFDNLQPISNSSNAVEFIHHNFTNSVVLADEISMDGFSKTDSIIERVKKVRSDMFIAHTGILDFNYRRFQLYFGLYQRDTSATDLSSIVRILKLKSFYNKISIQEIN